MRQVLAVLFYCTMSSEHGFQLNRIFHGMIIPRVRIIEEQGIFEHLSQLTCLSIILTLLFFNGLSPESIAHFSY